MKKDQRHHVLVGVTALFVGILIVVQWRSFTALTQENRDSQQNVFREIQILKETNQNLKDEIASLNTTFDETSNRALALKSIDEEISKYNILAGKTDVIGPGLKISFKEHIDAIWLVDLVNELFNAGAEAVAVNKIRLTDETQGFEVLPQGQIFLHVNTLELPYVFEVTGEPTHLEKAVTQESGLFDRIKEKYPQLEYVIEKQERIEIEGI